MHKKMRFWLPVMSVAVLLVIAGCRSAEPTAVPTTAPAVATTAPAVATTAPAVTEVVYKAPKAPANKLEWVPKTITDILDKYEGRLWWYTELPKPTSEPKYGGTLSRAGSSTGSAGIAHWDTTQTNQAAGAGSSMCYGRLLTFKQDRFAQRVTPFPEPDAAESWRILDDQLTWEFKLNPEVYWHDTAPVNGRRVTAEDIKFNIELFRDNSIYSGTFEMIENVEIIDPTTIHVKTSEPYSFLPNLLAGAAVQLQAPEKRAEEGGSKTWCIGWGPFKLVEYEPNGNWSLVKHDKYHLFGHTGMQLPYLDRVDVNNLSDAASVYAAMTTGKIMLMTANSVGDIKTIFDKNPRITGQIMPMAPCCHPYVSMNMTKAPFDDVRVRRALSMAMDRQAMVDTAYQGGATISEQIPMDALGWDTAPPIELRGPYVQYNPEAAKKLLAEAGFPNGFETEIIVRQMAGDQQATFDMMVFQWEKNLNVKAKFNVMESTASRKKWFDRTYPAMIIGQGTPATDWDSYTYGFMYSGSRSNYAMINHPEVDQIVTQARSTFDVEKQRELYTRLFEISEDQIFRLNMATRYWFTLYGEDVENASSGLYTWVTSYVSRGAESIWFKN